MQQKGGGGVEVRGGEPPRWQFQQGLAVMWVSSGRAHTFINWLNWQAGCRHGPEAC